MEKWNTLGLQLIICSSLWFFAASEVRPVKLSPRLKYNFPEGSNISPGSEISGSDDSSSSSLQETGNVETPEQIWCSEAGFFRHPENCHKFYRCVNLTETGEPFAIYKFDCPNDLVFDETIESCNWPNKAPLCDGQQTEIVIGNKNDKTSTTESSGYDQTSVSEPSQKPTNASECNKDGFFRDPNDCTRFYRCVEQGQIFIKYEFNCPDHLVFDERHGVCNWASQAPLCQTKGSQTTSSTSGSEMESGNSTPESGSFSEGVSPEDESTSVSSTPASESSSGNDTESETLGTTGTSVSSGEKTNGKEAPPDSSKESSKSSQENNFLCPEAGFFRNPHDCHKFYRCVDLGGNDGHFNIFEFDCPDGLVFDERESICNWPDNSPPCNENIICPPVDSSENSTDDGETEGTTTSLDTTTESVITTTQGNVIVDVGSLYDCRASGNFPFESDCVRFYRCEEMASSLVGLLFRCPEGYIFDEEIALCRRRPNDFVCSKSPPNSLIYRANSFLLNRAILASSKFLFD
ncbi:uncharacterized protein LOC143224971 [Tachypleus tridentatus]|uniref:uncharacterized protein LOC143224971 n=1 Tax=Tachypleus tridentatus TaxID=6853 RepID=UPI003FD6586C